jgi:hypothetical protein
VARREFRDRNFKKTTATIVTGSATGVVVTISRRRGTVTVSPQSPSSPLGTLQAQRAIEDATRATADQLRAVEHGVEAEKAQVELLNRRVSTTLASVTGQSATKTPQEWWTWWTDWTSQEASAPKPIYEVTEVKETVVDTGIRVQYLSCLPAGTPVFTELGPRPIESLRVGDRVLSKDIDTGELALRPVLRTTVRTPQPLVKLHSAEETLQATRGHHFFISGRGWVMARDLKPGDRFHGVRGTVTLTDVSSGDTAAVYNLVVERTNTYFVGRSLVLSHDVTPPSPTNVKVPGLAAN